MFGFGLKKTQVCVTTALLMTCWSICPYSCYPHAEEDEDPTVMKANQDYDEDQDAAHDQDKDSDELDHVDARGLENSEKDCAGEQKSCLELPCCNQEHTCYSKRGYVYVKICVKEVFVSSDTGEDQFVNDD